MRFSQHVAWTAWGMMMMAQTLHADSVSNEEQRTLTSLNSRPFDMGVSSQNSGARHGELDAAAQEWARLGNLFNVFTHVRWNALREQPLLAGHERDLEIAKAARAAGLDLVLVYDFTHDGRVTEDVINGIGLVNQLPDGSPLPEGELANAAVQNALKRELYAIVDAIQPRYVFVGLELNIFLYRCPEQWDDFVTIYHDAYRTMKKTAPETVVSVYTAGVPNPSELRALSKLLPHLDNLAYSIYCDDPWNLPDGYLTRIRQLDPYLPLFIPEFGVRSKPGSEEQQARALAFLLEKFAAVDTQGIMWCFTYDMPPNSGGPDWFVEAFETIGLRRHDGTEKPAYQVWKNTYELPPMFRDLWRVLLEENEQVRP